MDLDNSLELGVKEEDWVLKLEMVTDLLVKEEDEDCDVSLDSLISLKWLALRSRLLLLLLLLIWLLMFILEVDGKVKLSDDDGLGEEEGDALGELSDTEGSMRLGGGGRPGDEEQEEEGSPVTPPPPPFK
jgi:hypothetical protein